MDLNKNKVHYYWNSLRLRVPGDAQLQLNTHVWNSFFFYWKQRPPKLKRNGIRTMRMHDSLLFRILFATWFHAIFSILILRDSISMHAVILFVSFSRCNTTNCNNLEICVDGLFCHFPNRSMSFASVQFWTHFHTLLWSLPKFYGIKLRFITFLSLIGGFNLMQNHRNTAILYILDITQIWVALSIPGVFF